MFTNNLYLQQLQMQLSLGANQFGVRLPNSGYGMTGVPGGNATGTIIGTTGTVLQPIGPVLTGPGASKESKLYQLPTLDIYQRQKLEAAKKYAMDMSIKTALMKQNSQLPIHQSANVKRAQALVLLSRIYVGSVNYDITEDIIRQTFKPFGPIKNISLSYDPLTNKHKGFCFVEYELPESAQLALEQMNGFIIGGRPIKVGRPSNMPNAAPMQQELISESDLQKRVFVTSVHDDLSDEDLKMVFEAFGRITSCKLERDPANPLKHRGFGFVEYENSQSATDAIQSMNMFDLGGQLLRVGVAMTPPPGSPNDSMANHNASGIAFPQAAALAAANINSIIQHQDVKSSVSQPSVASSQSEKSLFQMNSPVNGLLPGKPLGKNNDDAGDSSTLEQQESFAISGREARGMVMQKLHRSMESKVLVLRNMVGVDDIDESLESEVTDECSCFGEVDRVIIYQEKTETSHLNDDEPNEGEDVVVKIFVVFSDAQSVEKASKSLNGRFFAGRTVIAQAYDQHLFDANDLSH